MKSLFIIIISIVFSLNAISQTCYTTFYSGGIIADCNNPSYDLTLVFEDEFNAQLDNDVWILPEGVIRAFDFPVGIFWLNPNNISVNNGEVTLLTDNYYQYKTYFDLKLNQYQTNFFRYSGSEMQTKYSFQRGYVESEIKSPTGEYDWPAFWLFGKDHNSSSRFNEIDVFEYFEPGKMQMNYWGYDGSAEWQCTTNSNVGTGIQGNFNVYGTEWKGHYGTISLNGILKREEYRFANQWGANVSCESVGSGLYLFKHVLPYLETRLHVFLSSQLQHVPFNEYPSMPRAMKSKYVRVYQRLPCVSNLTFTQLSALQGVQDEMRSHKGSNITINGNIVLNGDRAVQIITTDEITIHPGFETSSGTYFIARSDGTCSSFSSMTTDEVNEMEYSKEPEYEEPQSDVEDNFKLYPNPIRVGENVSYQYGEDLNYIECYNSVWQKIPILSDSENIYTSGLSEGIYFVRIYKKSGDYVIKKIIIQR